MSGGGNHSPMRMQTPERKEVVQAAFYCGAEQRGTNKELGGVKRRCL